MRCLLESLRRFGNFLSACLPVRQRDRRRDPPLSHSIHQPNYQTNGERVLSSALLIPRNTTRRNTPVPLGEDSSLATEVVPGVQQTWPQFERHLTAGIRREARDDCSRALRRFLVRVALAPKVRRRPFEYVSRRTRMYKSPGHLSLPGPRCLFRRLPPLPLTP